MKAEPIVRVIELLAAEPVDGLGPTLAGARLNMPKTTIYRILAELKDLGWCDQNPSGNYVLSTRFATLSERIRKGLVARGDMIVRRLGALDSVAQPPPAGDDLAHPPSDV